MSIDRVHLRFRRYRFRVQAAELGGFTIILTIARSSGCLEHLVSKIPRIRADLREVESFKIGRRLIASCQLAVVQTLLRLLELLGLAAKGSAIAIDLTAWAEHD